MASNGIAGFKGVLALSTANASSASDIAEIRNFNISMTMATIDVTTHDSSGHRDIVAGVESWSGTADYLQVMASTDHKAIFDVMAGRTQVDAEFYPTGSSSDGYFSGDIYLTGWDLSSPNEDALATNITFEGSGALTRSSSST